MLLLPSMPWLSLSNHHALQLLWHFQAKERHPASHRTSPPPTPELQSAGMEKDPVGEKDQILSQWIRLTRLNARLIGKCNGHGKDTCTISAAPISPLVCVMRMAMAAIKYLRTRARTNGPQEGFYCAVHIATYLCSYLRCKW